jgi:Uma2 family endonuclease
MLGSDMPALQKQSLTTDEFLAWSDAQIGRWELFDGVPVLIAPERAGHAATKFAAQTALVAAIGRAKLPCWMLPDGMTVRVDNRSAFEPDALVYCGAAVSTDAIEVPNPVIVVEVLSPGTEARDHGAKLAGYFSLPSVAHYLILDPDRRVLIHHKRGQGDIIETRILTDGLLRLDPPRLEAPVAEMFAAE